MNDLWLYALTIGIGVVVLCCTVFICLVMWTWRSKKAQDIQSEVAITIVMDSENKHKAKQPQKVMDPVHIEPISEINTTTSGCGEEGFETEGHGQDEGQCTTKGYDEDKEMVAKWLGETVGLYRYYSCFVENGYESLDFIKEISNNEELVAVGITIKDHQIKLMRHINSLKA